MDSSGCKSLLIDLYQGNVSDPLGRNYMSVHNSQLYKYIMKGLINHCIYLTESINTTLFYCQNSYSESVLQGFTVDLINSSVSYY